MEDIIGKMKKPKRVEKDVIIRKNSSKSLLKKV